MKIFATNKFSAEAHKLSTSQKRTLIDFLRGAEQKERVQDLPGYISCHDDVYAYRAANLRIFAMFEETRNIVILLDITVPTW